ncbi:Maf/Ham1, partial [Amylocystis lapponica]
PPPYPFPITTGPPPRTPPPCLDKLVGKRVVLASNSPRRKDILHTFVYVPSTFDESLPISSFQDVHEYPVATATHKAVEQTQPDEAPDLVIGADTVVLTHQLPGLSSTPYAETPFSPQDVLEKPISKEDNLRMLLDLNGGVCEVVTGVSVVYPVLEAPGYKIKSIEERTVVYFAENSQQVLQAYVDSGEGLDRAGGFAVQGLGGILVRKVDGDYLNVVGFPAASFFKFLDVLLEEESDFLEV